MSLEPFETSMAAWERARSTWPFADDEVRLALAPTIPHHCSEAFLRAANRAADGARVGLPHPPRGVQGPGAHRNPALRRRPRPPGSTRSACSARASPPPTRCGSIATTCAASPTPARRSPTMPAPTRGSGTASPPPAPCSTRASGSGIGTDACTCSDNLNMFEAMRIASMVSRVQELDYERWLATGEILDMATRGSAGVLGLDGAIGAIEPGRKADIVFLDLAHVNYVPLNDPVNQVVHGEDGTGVESVMIGGRMVLKGRRMTTVDEAKLARDAEAAAERLAAVNADTEGDDGTAGRRGGALRESSGRREDYHIERHARCTI